MTTRGYFATLFGVLVFTFAFDNGNSFAQRPTGTTAEIAAARAVLEHVQGSLDMKRLVIDVEHTGIGSSKVSGRSAGWQVRRQQLADTLRTRTGSLASVMKCEAGPLGERGCYLTGGVSAVMQVSEPTDGDNGVTVHVTLYRDVLYADPTTGRERRWVDVLGREVLLARSASGEWIVTGIGTTTRGRL